MNRDLSKTLAALRARTAPPVLLITGDDFRVRQGSKEIIDNLVPASDRGFNLERFDGAIAPWEQIEASLNTPPLLGGIKVLWVENAPYFSSRDERYGASERIIEIWSEGKRDDAGRLLMNLLVAHGWRRERWEEVLSQSATVMIATLLDTDDLDLVQDLIDHCRTSGLEPAGQAAAESDTFLKLLDEKIPPWAFLLLTASQVDRRTRLYKRLEELGAVLLLDTERDRTGRVSREQLALLVYEQLREAGKTAEPQARELILLRAGEELRGVHEEIEKLLLYVGDQPVVRRQDVEAIFSDRGEGWVFNLTHAIGDRDTPRALLHLARLLSSGEHPLKLLATIATEIRRLLAARELMDGELRGRWKRGMTYHQFQQRVCGDGTAPLTRSAYADFMCMQRADKFTLRELRSHLARIYETDLRLKTTGNHPGLLLEKLVLAMCLNHLACKTPPGSYGSA
jgi:DNA polymerase III delta subunit